MLKWALLWVLLWVLLNIFSVSRQSSSDIYKDDIVCWEIRLVQTVLVYIHYALLIWEIEIYGSRYPTRNFTKRFCKGLAAVKWFPSITPGILDRLIVINLQLQLYRSCYLKFKQSTKRLQNSTNFTTFLTIPNRPLQSLHCYKLIAPLRVYLDRSAKTKYSLAYEKERERKRRKYVYTYTPDFISI